MSSNACSPLPCFRGTVERESHNCVTKNGRTEKAKKSTRLDVDDRSFPFFSPARTAYDRTLASAVMARLGFLKNLRRAIVAGNKYPRLHDGKFRWELRDTYEPY